MKAGHMINVFAQVQGCDAEVYLNDVPVARLLQHQSAAASMPVHAWITAGQNELKLVVNPGPTPADALVPGAGRALETDAKARARLIVVPLGEMASNDMPPLLEAVFRASPDTTQVGPLAVTARGELPLAAGGRIWERSPPLQALSPDLEASALAFIAQLRDHLQHGETQALAALLRPKILDVAASYGLDGETEVNAMAAEWAAMARRPGWAMAPIAAEQASLRLCGGGRFVECIAKDWLPLLRSQMAAGGRVRLRAGIALSAGRWNVVA